MPTDIGLDTEIDAVPSLTNGSTNGFAGAIKAIVDKLRSNNNRFGSAATKDTGTGSGNVPELDSNGKLPVITIPDTFALPANIPREVTRLNQSLSSGYGGQTGKTITELNDPGQIGQRVMQYLGGSEVALETLTAVDTNSNGTSVFVLPAGDYIIRDVHVFLSLRSGATIGGLVCNQGDVISPESLIGTRSAGIDTIQKAVMWRIAQNGRSILARRAPRIHANGVSLSGTGINPNTFNFAVHVFGSRY